MWSNFHTHSEYCDGKGKIQDYLETARNFDVKWIGLSSHAPLPFPCKWCMKSEALPRYIQEIDSVKERFPELEIFKGLEVDYIPKVVSPADFEDRLDFTIGSIHFVDSLPDRYWEIDNTSEVFREGLSGIFQGDIRAAISRYYDLTRQMITLGSPDILGHMDKIKINAGGVLFEESEPWYIAQVDKTLESVAEADVVVEVNTRGIYKKKSDTTYPSPWILERIFSRNIPITLSSDAHHPDDLIREFASTRALLADIGFKNICVLKSGIWENVPLNEYGATR